MTWMTAALLALQMGAQASPAVEPGPDCAGCVTLPVLTPVRVELLVELGSRVSRTGDAFPIRLAEPVAVDGRVLLPAGLTGMGEVVHAKKGGGGGAGGELVLAARYLEVDGRRLRLRSMSQGPAGKAQVTEAAITGALLGPVGLFVTGRNAVLPAGTMADAKTAEPFAIAPPAAAAGPAAASQTTKGEI